MTDMTQTALVALVADVTSAYVSGNSIQSSALPGLIESLLHTIVNLGKEISHEAGPEKLKPAVSIKKSVTDEYIIGLEDGRKLRSLKRYLAGRGMTP